jgi:dephospho-CoA kinase
VSSSDASTHHKPVLLGLTGDIASGKSTVTKLLEKRGAAVIDSDLLVRELYSNHEFAQQVAQLFPNEYILLDDGRIDRATLGGVVFKDTGALKILEALVHPRVERLRADKIARLSTQGVRVVVLEAVKLVESGQAKICDAVWWIRARSETQFERLVNDRGMSEIEAIARLRNQPVPEEKARMLQELGVPIIIIHNDSTLEDLETNIEAAWQELRALFEMHG